jgi:hypothetical protein
LTHESREHKRRYEKSKKQVELDGDNEARSSKRGSSGRQALQSAGFDRLKFQNLHDERSLEAQVEKENFHQFNNRFSQGEGNGRFSQMAFSACCGSRAALFR